MLRSRRSRRPAPHAVDALRPPPSSAWSVSPLLYRGEAGLHLAPIVRPSLQRVHGRSPRTSARDTTPQSPRLARRSHRCPGLRAGCTASRASRRSLSVSNLPARRRAVQPSVVSPSPPRPLPLKALECPRPSGRAAARLHSPGREPRQPACDRSTRRAALVLVQPARESARATSRDRSAGLVWPRQSRCATVSCPRRANRPARPLHAGHGAQPFEHRVGDGDRAAERHPRNRAAQRGQRRGDCRFEVGVQADDRADLLLADGPRQVRGRRHPEHSVDVGELLDRHGPRFVQPPQIARQVGNRRTRRAPSRPPRTSGEGA